MFEKIVLIVSYQQDVHAQHVLQKLEDCGVRGVLLNVGEYPHSFESSLLLNPQYGLDARFFTGATALPVNNIIGVWWRRPLGAYRAETTTMMEKYITSEAEAYIRSLPYMLGGARWVSNPEATRIASRKPYQLLVAQRIGLRIPNTFVGNSKSTAIAFLEQMKDKNIVAKSVCSGFVRLNQAANDVEDLNRVIYTKRISRTSIMDHLDWVPNCPFILQEEIEKDFDVRVTVVGNKVFAVAVMAEADDGRMRGVDWRHHEYRRKYSHHILPNEVTELCRKVTIELGLSFGCIDLGYSVKEGYTFFEINPQGQWLPSETVVGHPISDALVGLLLS